MTVFWKFHTGRESRGIKTDSRLGDSSGKQWYPLRESSDVHRQQQGLHTKCGPELCGEGFRNDVEWLLEQRRKGLTAWLMMTVEGLYHCASVL